MDLPAQHLHRALRLVRGERKAWTFADLLRTPDGEGDPEVFDALCDAFCAAVGAASCVVTDPGPDGVVWFHALAA